MIPYDGWLSVQDAWNEQQLEKLRDNLQGVLRLQADIDDDSTVSSETPLPQEG